MKIEFDPAKREATLLDRGLDFLDAPRIFDNVTQSAVDSRIGYGETRGLPTASWMAALLFWFTRCAAMICGLFQCVMRTKRKSTMPDSDDYDEAPMLTKEWFDHAEIRIGNKVIRPATGVLTKDGIRPIGRPTLGDAPKKQVTLRLDADLIDRFRATGKGWQSRINAALRKASGI